MIRRFLRVLLSTGAVAVIAYGLIRADSLSNKDWLLLLLSAGVFLAISWWPATRSDAPIFNRSLLRWATLLLVAFVLVTVQLVKVQIVESHNIVDRVEVTADGEVVQDPRIRAGQLDEQRGAILDRNGVVLANSEPAGDGTYRRVYREPSAADLIGYYSPLLYGASQIEAEFDDYLSGETGGNELREWLDDVLHREQQGHDLRLSLDADLQSQAADLLAGRPGAVVMLNAKTGAILALDGAPTFDPARLNVSGKDVSEADLQQAEDYWAQLTSDPNAPLVFRPTQGLYSPGSVFKMVTATAAIDSGLAAPDSGYRDEGSLEVDGRVIIELNRPDTSRALWSLEEAFAYSLNVVFAQVGLQVTGPTLLDYATRFGFGAEIPFDLPVNASQLASEPSALNERVLLADTGFGQGQILATPLQMAMVTAAIANDGEMMKPRLVEEVDGANGNTLKTFKPERWRRVMSTDSAAAMQQLMEASSGYGFASGAQIEGATVGGKTGTAENGTGQPHAWFVGYASRDGQDPIVVAVMVENGGRGGETALPIGHALLESALAK